MTKRQQPQPEVCVIYDEADAPWQEWVSAHLSSVGIRNRPQPTTDRAAFSGRRDLILDSNRSRLSFSHAHLSGLAPEKGIWAGAIASRRGHMVVRVDGADIVDTWRGRGRFYEWDLDLVGRDETDARTALLRGVTKRFGVTQKAPSPHQVRARYPGLVTVFLSYRRADNECGLVTRLHDELAGRLPQVRHFLDISDPDPELHVPTRLRAAIRNAPVLLALVGHHWLGRRGEPNVRARSSRIKQPDDFVRMEIAEALAGSVPIVPVVMAGAPMPTKRQVPTDIQLLLSAKPRLTLDDSTFRRDVHRIVASITRVHIRRPRWDSAGTIYSTEPVFAPEKSSPE